VPDNYFAVASGLHRGSRQGGKLPTQRCRDQTGATEEAVIAVMNLCSSGRATRTQGQLWRPTVERSTVGQNLHNRTQKVVKGLDRQTQQLGGTLSHLAARPFRPHPTCSPSKQGTPKNENSGAPSTGN